MCRVEWIQDALNDLAALWLQGDTSFRQAITEAANSLDEDLHTDPFRQSESRDEGERVAFAYPLAAQIEVEEQQRRVWVLHVWRFRRRGEK
jgi:hypothetical protein